LYSAQARAWYFSRTRSGSVVPGGPLITLAGTPCRARNSLNAALPPPFIFATNLSFFQESMVTDCTNEMCTPRLRWIPEHSRHM
jgi:hypothetical protein